MREGAARGGKQRLRHGAANDPHFRNSSSQCAFRGFEFQDHSTGNFIVANQLLYLAATNDSQHFFAIEDAFNVSEKDQAVRLDKFGGGSGHVIGVDVVNLTIGAQPETGSDRYD